MAEILTRVKSNFSELSATKKLLVGLALAGGFAAISVLWLWTSKPEFHLLYADLSPDDAGAVIEKLKEMNVLYQFSKNGTAILVPAEKVHELRLQLASQGLPQGGGVGFEIFDQTSFGTTEFAQKLNYRRALQGELARTITQLSEVLKTRVHLVIPEKALFTDQQDPPQAAVVLSLLPGKHLSESKIQGITHLISSSVAGMKPENVTIVDGQGNIRTNNMANASFSSQINHSEREYKHQLTLEKKIERKIQTMLSKVVGQQKAVVRVSSILDFRQIETTEERFDPETQVIRSTQKSQEEASGSSKSSRPSAGGVPGVASNQPSDNQTKGTAGAESNSSRMNNEVINYEISKITSRVIEPSGSIKQLSVAVLIDGSYESITDKEGTTSSKYLPRGEEEMQKLTAIVKKAMGYSEERNDQVEVVNVAFKTNTGLEDEVIPEPMVNKIMKWMPLVRQIMGPLLILLVLFAVIKPILKTAMAPPLPALSAPSSTSDNTITSASGETNSNVGENALPEPGAQTAAGTIAQGDTGLPQLEEPKVKDDRTTVEDMIKLAEENPQVATQLVKKWIMET